MSRSPAPAVVLVGETAESIRGHARRSYPEECCGALLGRDGEDGARVSAVVEIPNARREARGRHFLVSPRDYLAAERAAESRGLRLLGFYHSHPDHPARPSAVDLGHAWPNLHYLIVAVDGGEPGEVSAWTLREDRSAFDGERLDREPDREPDRDP
jgi:proteasome lid subunit RPN8/RPN11